VSPTGDDVTLTPSTVPVGYVRNRNASWRATVYGDRGFLEIGATSNEPVALPEGAWKVHEYTIFLDDPPEADGDSAEDEGLGFLAGALGKDSATARPPSWVAAGVKGTYPAIEVVQGETVELPFGPPYRAVVGARRGRGSDLADLSLKILGSPDEICTDIRIEGERPDAPTLLITDPAGEIVERGEFEYG